MRIKDVEPSPRLIDNMVGNQELILEDYSDNEVEEDAIFEFEIHKTSDQDDVGPLAPPGSVSNRQLGFFDENDEFDENRPIQ